MKGTFVAAVAALAGGVAAHANHGHDHGRLFAHKRDAEYGETCVPGCTTYTHVVTGPGTLVPPAPVTSTAAPTTTAAPPPPPAPTTTVVVVPLPTPEAHTCPTPGTYTFPATTITVSETTTVCAATSTSVPSGTHTIGGVTTVVETSTTVVCPYATVSTSGTVTTSTILMTTYVCPSAGTYTIAPTTTAVTTDTVIVYPVPTTICPGTYTQPEQVVTVTETDYVTWCPYESSFVSTSTAAPAPPPPAAPTKAAAPPPSSPPPSGSSGGELTGSNDHFGVTYTPYEPTNGACKSAGQVSSDIAQLKSQGFEIIRVYSTDCNTLETVGAAVEANGLQLIIGVFVSGGCTADTPDVKEQINAISSWAKWDIVKLIVVGNEAIADGYCSAQELAELVTAVKSSCSGYSGPYTISETLNIWLEEGVASAICPVIDVTGANIHAYFNAAVVPEAAGEFVLGQIDLLKKVCAGNDVINLECGWPTAGVCNGAACPGVEEQAIAIKAIREKVGDKTVFFSYDNDEWKEPGTCECEQHWGISSCFS